MTAALLDVTSIQFPEAKCAGAPIALFFPERGDTEAVQRAKAICGTCPHTAECLEGALERGEKEGIWGGTSERQRRRMRSEWLTRFQPDVIAVLEEGPLMSVEITRALGIYGWTVRAVVRALSRAGALEQVGTGFDGSRMVPVWGLVR